MARMEESDGAETREGLPDAAQVLQIIRRWINRLPPGGVRVMSAVEVRSWAKGRARAPIATHEFAEAARLRERQAREMLRQLEENGVLIRERRYDEVGRELPSEFAPNAYWEGDWQPPCPDDDEKKATPGPSSRSRRNQPAKEPEKPSRDHSTRNRARVQLIAPYLAIAGAGSGGSEQETTTVELAPRVAA